MVRDYLFRNFDRNPLFALQALRAAFEEDPIVAARMAISVLQRDPRNRTFVAGTAELFCASLTSESMGLFAEIITDSQIPGRITNEFLDQFMVMDWEASGIPQSARSMLADSLAERWLSDLVQHGPTSPGHQGFRNRIALAASVASREQTLRRIHQALVAGELALQDEADWDSVYAMLSSKGAPVSDMEGRIVEQILLGSRAENSSQELRDVILRTTMAKIPEPQRRAILERYVLSIVHEEDRTIATAMDLLSDVMSQSERLTLIVTTLDASSSVYYRHAMMESLAEMRTEGALSTLYGYVMKESDRRLAGQGIYYLLADRETGCPLVATISKQHASAEVRKEAAALLLHAQGEFGER
jgi:hypothetical protein